MPKLLIRKYRVLVVLENNPYMQPREMYVRNIEHLPKGWMLAKGECSIQDQYNRSYHNGRARQQA